MSITKDQFIAKAVGELQGIAAIASNKTNDTDYAKALRKCINDIIRDGVQELAPADGGDPDCPQVPPPPSQ